MEYLRVFLLALGSAAALFILTKLIGNKQISEMNMFDYIVGITIGSIGAEMATGIDGHAGYALIAMAVYAVLAFLISVISNHSVKLRRVLSGTALIIMSNGKIYKANLKKARMDINEFLSECRLLGYFDLNEIDTAFLEPNGRVSILPRADYHPATPKDMGIEVKKSPIFQNVIIDGVILKENLKQCQLDEKWLKSQLKAKGYESEKDVFLAVCNVNGDLYAFSDCLSAPKTDPFL